MSSTVEAKIHEKLRLLDEPHQEEMLDFLEYLIAKSGATSNSLDWPVINPSQDLAQYIGIATGFPEDGVAYQRQIRDTEWP
jgi:hypothetical protein